MKFQFGFEDFSYGARYTEASPLPRSMRHRAPKVLSKAQIQYGEGKSTKEVSANLEKKYHVVEAFIELEEDFISGLLEDTLDDNFQQVLSGQDISQIMTEQVAEKIERRFRRDLAQKKFDGVIAGVPTKASVLGISHLRKKVITGTSRPSFVDTGLYSRSFRVWIEE